MKDVIKDLIIQLNLLNFDMIFRKWMDIIIPIYDTNKEILKYKLNKDGNKNVKTISIPKSLNIDCDNITLNQINNSKFKDITFEFAEVLIEKFPPNVLINLYNNLKTVKIKRDFFESIAFDSTGLYSFDKNRIDLLTTKSIYHELFHMASSRVIFNFAYTGFRIYDSNKRKSVGMGLNEGYTELMTHRYFSNKRLYNPYKYETFIVNKLEQIIGKEKMEKLYLTGNLIGLIDLLKKYSSKEEVMGFIATLDYISMYAGLILIPTTKFKKNIREITTFLINTYIEKLKDEVKKGDISISEFEKLCIEYINAFKKIERIGMYSYRLLPSKINSNITNDINNIQKELIYKK